MTTRSPSPTRRAFLAGGSLFGLSACALPTEQVALREPEEEAEGGISGTGLRRDGIEGTGIVGTVLGFGSILINGVRVQTPPQMRMIDAFGRIDLGTLKPGHTVTLQTDGADLVGHTLAQHHPVIGRIDAVMPDGSVWILGTRVILPPDVTVIVGEHARVSGTWDGPVVRATRLDPAQPGLASASGTVTASGINGVAIDGALPEPGVFATVTGAAADGVLRQDTLSIGRFTAAGAPLNRILAEGYLERAPEEAAGYILSGFGHSFDARARLDAAAQGLHLFRGRYDQDFAVEEAVPLPDLQAERAALLLSDSPFGGAISTR
ncbi:MAG: hypothetical protein AAGJ92_02355 [Pseudomonadota bacterium]